MEVGKKFRYSSYWGTWSRVLRWQDKNQTQVEVDLTPVNSCWDFQWERTKRINIREHSTSPGKSDKSTDELPLEVLNKMVSMLGGELVHRLLNEDFLSQIDWDKYQSICNGGASFNEIRITPTSDSARKET